MVVDNPVNVIRVNGQICPGVFSGVETEANLENQNVKTTIDLDKNCARSMFLNEAVEIETLPRELNNSVLSIDIFWVAEGYLQGLSL